MSQLLTDPVANQQRTPKQRVPAIDGWFTTDEREPQLLGTRCATCGTFFFPPERTFCRNPACDGTDLEEVRLSRRGRVWSSTVNHYPPPPPAVSSDPFVPYGVAAVELDEERMVVLGQVAGERTEPLPVGAEVEVTLDTLYEDDDHEYLVWKWRPVEAG
ncbi:MAG: Zn-ribbon domain-containing OB-fold protein [Actinomycetota bacterium]